MKKIKRMKNEKKKSTNGINNVVNLILITLILTAAFQNIFLIPVNAQELDSNNTKSSRGSDDKLNIDSATLIGEFKDDKASFTLDLVFYVTSTDNISYKIPLVGPAAWAMALNLTIDSVEHRIQFENNYYYFLGNLTSGKHYLTFKFKSKLLLDEIIEINYTLFGSVLNYIIEFRIPLNSNKKIYIIESSNALISEDSGNMVLEWQYFALNNINWKVKWTEYTSPTSNDIFCEFTSEVMIFDTKAVLEINYELEFEGFAFERLTFSYIERLSIKHTNLGTIKSNTKKPVIEFDELIKDRLSLKVVFEKRFVNQLNVEVPRPLDCEIKGSVSLFSISNIIINPVENNNATLIGYSGPIRTNVNFIGNYYFTESSSLVFDVSIKEIMVAVEIIDTLIPTFDGYDLESWVLFNFYGSSPNSITLDLPVSVSSGKPQKPKLLINSNMPLPILDQNWNDNLNRLTLWLSSNLSNEYILGLKWSFSGNNVSMQNLIIAETTVMNYHVVYYLENGMFYDPVDGSGLIRSGYDSIPQQLRANLRSGSNLEIYQVKDRYHSIINIEKTTDLSSEIFLRAWVDDVNIDIHQIIRITSKSGIASRFIFNIPPDVTSIDVTSCASWTIDKDLLIIYTYQASTNLIIFYINAKVTNISSSVSPFIPRDIHENKIYVMFGSASNLEISINPTNADSMNPDELPKYFLSEVKTPKAVLVYYSTSKPNFSVQIQKYAMEENPTTVIELAQITYITSIDGKIAAQLIYLMKNVDRLEMHVELPQGGVVWMVLVAGKTIPTIQNDNILTVTLIRSTLTGENIAFPVEIVYMLNTPMEDLEFLIPKADVSILNLKVNIGLPSSMVIKDPKKFNPNFEVDGWDKWRSTIDYSGGTLEPFSDYRKVMSNQLSGVSYDVGNIEPDWVYIGLEDLDEDMIEVEEISESESEQNYFSFQIDETNSFYDSVSNLTFARISLSQGQYEIRNSGKKRQVTVMGGNVQQVIFDSGDELVFTDIPPIYLQFPESGQVVRLSAILIKPRENVSITLVESTSHEVSGKNTLLTIIGSPMFLLFFIILIIIVDLCAVYYIKSKRPEKDKSAKQSTKKGKKGLKPEYIKKKHAVKQHKKSKARSKERLTEPIIEEPFEDEELD